MAFDSITPDSQSPVLDSPALPSKDFDKREESHAAESLRLRSRRQRHWTMLIGSLGVLSLSLLLTTTADSHVALGGAAGHPLPPLCGFRALFGRPCPGCGLTRSFVALVHLDWQAAWQAHRLGWLLFAALLLQIPYRIAALRQPHCEVLGTLLPRLFGWLLIVLLLIVWAASWIG